MQFLVAKGCGPTGRLLEQLVNERLKGRKTDAVVSYGLRYTGTNPCLNKNAGLMDKFQQGRTLSQKGILVVPHLTLAEAQAAYKKSPGAMFARKRNHVAGKDIMMVLQEEDFQMRTRAGADFFTPYIPSTGEFRVWVYRKQHLGTYQKVLSHPEQYTKVGRNYKNGFAFQLVRSESVPRGAVELAQAAVDTLQLDFGAVDILQGKDGKFYVLEINTAPGVEGEGRQVIQSLADKIAKWEELKHPVRNGSPEAAAKKNRR